MSQDAAAGISPMESMAPPVSRASQVLAVMRLTYRQLFRTRRTLFFVLVGMVPPAIALLFAAIRKIPSAHLNFTGFELFSNLMVFLYLPVLLLLVALFYGTLLINAEVEERTITYLLIRPVPRPLLVFGKYLTYIIASSLLLLPSMVLTYVIAEFSDGLTGFTRHLPYLFWDASVLLLGSLAYGALFTLFGTALRHPIMVGLSFAFVWEWVVTIIPGRFGKFTILHYLLSLFPHSTAQRLPQTLSQSMASKPMAVVVLILAAATFLALAMALFSRREYVLEQ